MSMPFATRRYLWRLFPCMAAYVAGLIAANLLERHFALAGIWPYLLALLPALPMVGVVAAMGLYLVEERDEYLRLQQAKASLFATGILLIWSTVTGFMEDFAHVPHLTHAPFVVWCVGLVAGQGLVRVVWR